MRAHPEQCDQVRFRALKIPTADLTLPAQKLLAAKAVRTTGAKRGTKYHLRGKVAANSKRAPKSKRAARKVVVPVRAKKAAKQRTAKSAKAKSARAAAGTKAQPATVMA